MDVYVLISLNLILAGLCFYKKFKLSGIYLGILGISDILRLIIRQFYIGQTMPYVGGALMAANIKNFILVLVPVLFMKICYRSILKDSGWLPELIGLTGCIAVYFLYHLIYGAPLILAFNIYFILMNLFCGGIILNHFTKVKGNKDQLILLICAFGGAMSFILSIIFANWIVITTCNFLYYLAILWLCLKDKNALPEFLQSS